MDGREDGGEGGEGVGENVGEEVRALEARGGGEAKEGGTFMTSSVTSINSITSSTPSTAKRRPRRNRVKGAHGGRVTSYESLAAKAPMSELVADRGGLGTWSRGEKGGRREGGEGGETRREQQVGCSLVCVMDLFAFGLGVQTCHFSVSFSSPCFYPLIPLYIPFLSLIPSPTAPHPPRFSRTFPEHSPNIPHMRPKARSSGRTKSHRTF